MIDPFWLGCLVGAGTLAVLVWVGVHAGAWWTDRIVRKYDDNDAGEGK